MEQGRSRRVEKTAKMATSSYTKPKRQTKRPRRLDDMYVVSKPEKETIPYVDDDRDEDWSGMASSGQESGGDSGSSAQGSSLSLDVLAQVATETLRREPGRSQAKPKIKPAKKKRLLTARGVSSMETLTLEQIRMLSDTSLINMFADNKSDELRRIFTYTCFLMPDKCKANFSSFGNESRARQQVRMHLLGHIGELLQESCMNNDSGTKKFTAEPLHARQKRIAREKATQQRINKKKIVSKGRTNNPPKGSMFTVMKSPNAQASRSAGGSSSTASPGKRRVVSSATTQKNKGPTPGRSSAPNEHEQTIIDLLSRSQPFADHNYTTVFGKRYCPPSPGPDEDVAGDHGHTLQSNMTVSVRVNSGSRGKSNQVHVPVIRLSQLPNGELAPDGGTLLVAENEIDLYGSKNSMTSRSSYPPMPKSDPAHKGKVDLPEEELTSDEEAGPPTHVIPARPRKKVKVGSCEQERKLALKYIRELRYRNRPNEAVTLVCKICRDKTFTATATLLYHYRSHAGIKPFVCLICNTTFTRQHSLNYHMLIHNNQSRFTCKECGRKFRHPSHFKEHLRRHTGETPFHCTDCPLRFKTRNTYKRHLRTRHNKMLTSTGIQVEYQGTLEMAEDTDS